MLQMAVVFLVIGLIAAVLGFGGIAGVPLLVGAIGYFGFPGAMIAAAIALVVLMVPIVLIFVGQPPVLAHTAAMAAADALIMRFATTPAWDQIATFLLA